MSRLRALLFPLLALLLSPLLQADNASLKICNHGRLEIDVATAARVQLFITGYRWETSGWYVVAPGECSVVYSAEYDEAGPITPQSGARIAYAVTNSDGLWGAYHSGVVDNGGWIHTGSTGNICVKRGEVFKFVKPEGDPAVGCDDIAMPVADEFLPDHPGDYTLTMDWEGEKFFVPLGAASGSTARLIYGDAVHFDGRQWVYANGTPLPKDLLIKKTGFPPLLPKWQHFANTAPVAGYIKEIKDVMSAVHCTDTSIFKSDILGAEFDMDDFGTVISTYTQAMSSIPPRNVSAGAALANLSLSDPTIQDRGCVLVNLTCNDVPCVRDSDNDASVYWNFYVNTREQANQVLDALRKLAPFYPQGSGEIHSK